MFVLTDIEWITDEKGHYSPTQLAAVKVDAEWNSGHERFSAFIKPKNGEYRDLSHIACTGGSSTDFWYAKSAYTTFSDFLGWLSDDDVILFWHKESEAVFKKLVTILLGKKSTRKTICLNQYVYSFLAGQPNSNGDVYKLAESRGIYVNSSYKHYSPNDVRVLQELLKQINFPQSSLEKTPDGKPNSELSHPYMALMSYQYEILTNTIHKSDCELLPSGRSMTVGYPTLKTAIKKNYKPCKCCEKEFREAIREKNADIIERSQYNYIYTSNSNVFHKRSCGTMLSAKNILGAIKYETAVETGRVPCKICNPTENDIYASIPTGKKVSALIKVNTNNATKEERQAIIRQKTALKDRLKMLNQPSLSEEKKRDIYTLTQPRFAFWAARGYQTFHQRNCPKLQQVSDLRGFATFKEATRAGLTPCKKCKPTAKQDAVVSIPIFNRVRLNEKVEDIEELCKEAGYLYSREKAFFYLETPTGKWRIDTNTSPIRLEHINLVKTPKMEQYHKQPRVFLSFVDVFNYIKRHDSKLMSRTGDEAV